LSPEQLNHIEMNLQLSIDERIDQLQSAVNLIKAKLALKRPKDLEVAKELEIIKNNSGKKS